MASLQPLNALYFYISQTCNQRCDHCYINAGPDISHRHDMDIQTIIKKISEAQALGLRYIKFTGGEPFIHPGLMTIVDYCGEQDIGMSIETNGTLINRYIVDKLAQYEVYMAVSIDHPDAALHDAFRHMPGAFNKTAEALQYLVDAGVTAQITASLHRDNSDAKSLWSLVELAERFKVVKLKLNFIAGDGRAGNMGNLLSVKQAIAVNNFIETEIIPSTSLQVVTSLPLAFKSVRVIRQTAAHFSCDIKHIIGLLPDGCWSLCGYGVENHRLVLSDVDTPLESIWENAPQLIELRETRLVKTQGVCANCVMNAVCRGNCPAQTFNHYGTFRAPYPICQSAWEAGLFPKTRLLDTIFEQAWDETPGNFGEHNSIDEKIVMRTNT